MLDSPVSGGPKGAQDGTLSCMIGGEVAILSMALLSIYLRQRGSPESKPVGAPHSATGVEG